MGLRFRKSFKIAPGLKLNLNKKSIGLTAGGKGFHFTKNSSGRTTASAGIPGTGLYYQSTKNNSSTKTNTKKKSTSSNTTQSKDNGEKKTVSSPSGRSVICAFLLVLTIVFRACSPDSEDESSTVATEQTTSIETNVSADIAETEIATEQITEGITETAEPQTEEPQTEVPQTEAPQTEAPQTEAPAPVVEQTQAQVVASNDKTYVLNTNTKAFHNQSCSSVGKIKAENYQEYTGIYDDVISMGYNPCKRCNPR